MGFYSILGFAFSIRRVDLVNKGKVRDCVGELKSLNVSNKLFLSKKPKSLKKIPNHKW